MKNNLKNNLKEERLKKGFKQTEVSNSVGISLRTYQRMELEQAIPKVYTALKLAKVLSKPVDELFILPGSSGY